MNPIQAYRRNYIITYNIISAICLDRMTRLKNFRLIQELTLSCQIVPTRTTLIVSKDIIVAAKITALKYSPRTL